MKNYYFYVTSDKNKEEISHTQASSIEEATEYFASIKQMSVDLFLTIFTVTK